jgi:iron-sulfur cluster assembly accessory protein
MILRLSVDGGGCSGFQYIIKIDNKEKIQLEEDSVITKGGLVLAVDNESIPYLEGAVLEFMDSLIKSGFQIKENPQAEVSCSCGTSFSPKLNI